MKVRIIATEVPRLRWKVAMAEKAAEKAQHSQERAWGVAERRKDLAGLLLSMVPVTLENAKALAPYLEFQELVDGPEYRSGLFRFGNNQREFHVKLGCVTRTITLDRDRKCGQKHEWQDLRVRLAYDLLRFAAHNPAPVKRERVWE